MAGRFTWLDRPEGESVRTYDNRINELAAFHSGYAFLSYENYCPEFNAFAVYTVWNHEFNSKLVNPLPEGGFMMHCDAERAGEMLKCGHGFPVFVKLYAKQGRLYVESMALADKDAVFDLYFNGCDVKAPEGLVFMGNEAPELMPVMKAAAKENVPGPVGGGRGSFSRSSYLHGSYRNGSFVSMHYAAGSYIHGSYQRSSYVRGSYINAGGSYKGGLSGSYLSWFFGGSSYLKLLFRAGSYRNYFYGGSYSAFAGSFKGFAFGTGSYTASSYTGGSLGLGSYIRGSYTRGSYINGSFTGRYFLTGSFYNGSYHRGSFIYGGFADVCVGSERKTADTVNNAGGEDKQEGFVIRRLIEELGYGLDLI